MSNSMNFLNSFTMTAFTKKEKNPIKNREKYGLFSQVYFSRKSTKFGINPMRTEYSRRSFSQSKEIHFCLVGGVLGIFGFESNAISAGMRALPTIWNEKERQNVKGMK